MPTWGQAPLRRALRALASFSNSTLTSAPITMTESQRPAWLAQPTQGLPTPHRSTLPPCPPGPSRPTLPSPDLVPASAPRGGTVSSLSCCDALPDPVLELYVSMAAISSLEAVPRPQAHPRWQLGEEPTVAWAGASSALHLGCLPGSTSSKPVRSPLWASVPSFV